MLSNATAKPAVIYARAQIAAAFALFLPFAAVLGFLGVSLHGIKENAAKRRNGDTLQIKTP